MTKYSHIIAEVCRKPWAILPEKLAVIAQFVSLSAAGEKLSEEEVLATMNAGPRMSPRGSGAVAVIPVYGVISRRVNMMSKFSGGTSIEQLTSSFRSAMSDPSVKAVVLNIDSPGGTVDGVPELAAEILSSRSQKKTIAMTDTMAGSAAYWLASACDEIVVTPSGAVGSIGVYAVHEDCSKALETQGVNMTVVSAGKYKAEDLPFRPLTAEAKDALQAYVDKFYGMFVKGVAQGRGVSQESIRGGYGEGRMVMAQDAVKEGMADRVATLDQVLAGLGVGSGSAKVAASLSRRARELELHQ